jgi:hypothetical protein
MPARYGGTSKGTLMKKLILFVLASLTVASLTMAGCTEKEEETTGDSPSTSKPTFFPRLNSN